MNGNNEKRANFMALSDHERIERAEPVVCKIAAQLVLEEVERNKSINYHEVAGLYLIAIRCCTGYGIGYNVKMRQYLVDGLRGHGLDPRRNQLADQIENCRILSEEIFAPRLVDSDGKEYKNVTFATALQVHLLSEIHQLSKFSEYRLHMINVAAQMVEESNPFKDGKLGKGDFIRITRREQIVGPGGGLVGAWNSWWGGDKLKKESVNSANAEPAYFVSTEESVRDAYHALGELCSNTWPQLDFMNEQDRKELVLISRATVKAYTIIKRDMLQHPEKVVTTAEVDQRALEPTEDVATQSPLPQSPLERTPSNKQKGNAIPQTDNSGSTINNDGANVGIPDVLGDTKNQGAQSTNPNGNNDGMLAQLQRIEHNLYNLPSSVMLGFISGAALEYLRPHIIKVFNAPSENMQMLQKNLLPGVGVLFGTTLAVAMMSFSALNRHNDTKAVLFIPLVVALNLAVAISSSYLLEQFYTVQVSVGMCAVIAVSTTVLAAFAQLLRDDVSKAER